MRSTAERQNLRGMRSLLRFKDPEHNLFGTILFEKGWEYEIYREKNP